MNLASAQQNSNTVMQAMRSSQMNPLALEPIQPSISKHENHKLQQDIIRQAKQIQALNKRNFTLQELNQTQAQGNRNYIKQLKQLRHDEHQYKNQIMHLRKHLNVSQKRCKVMEKKCEQHIEALQLQSLDMDTTSDDLCSTSIALNHTTAQHELQQRQYTQLMKNYTLLLKQHDTAIRHSWFNAKIDTLHGKILQLKKCIKAQPISLPFNLNTEKFSVQKSSKLKDKKPSEKAKPSWLSISKSLPISTGMYQVSNGEKSALAYFNAETRSFQQPGFSIRFWLQRSEEAGINAINNGFRA
ncbi:MAG: hypothetical protein HRU20_12355 [Pseudomonadales bacterium]|nr:hypothetical protein [Pseudomonadales bacterium]